MKNLVRSLQALFVAGFVAALLPAQAQTAPGEIRGKVLLKKDSTALQYLNAWVDTPNGAQGVETDKDGKYTIKPLNPGTYQLHVKSIEYVEIIQTIDVKPNQISYAQDVYMYEDATTLEAVVVLEKRVSLINPEETSVQTVNYKQIQHNPNLRNIKLLTAGMDSGIMVTEGGDSYVRGGRSDASIYFVDGVKCRDGNIQVPGVAIGSLTVYTGGVPAKYGDVTSGVIIVETKSYFDLYYERLANQ